MLNTDVHLPIPAGSRGAQPQGNASLRSKYRAHIFTYFDITGMYFESNHKL
jgi:hypothetical protein